MSLSAVPSLRLCGAYPPHACIRLSLVAGGNPPKRSFPLYPLPPPTMNRVCCSYGICIIQTADHFKLRFQMKSYIHAILLKNMQTIYLTDTNLKTRIDTNINYPTNF